MRSCRRGTSAVASGTGQNVWHRRARFQDQVLATKSPRVFFGARNDPSEDGGSSRFGPDAYGRLTSVVVEDPLLSERSCHAGNNNTFGAEDSVINAHGHQLRVRLGMFDSDVFGILRDMKSG